MAIEINPGTVLIVDSSRIVGGRESSRVVIEETDINSGAGRETRAETMLRIADVAEDKRARAIRAEVAHAIRRTCASSPVGWTIDRAKMGDLDRRLYEICDKASAFNASAKTCVLKIRVTPIEISVALGSPAAQAIAEHVREELGELRSFIKAGDVGQIRAWFLRNENLPDLGVGPQADMVRFAMDQGKSAMKLIKEAIGRSEAPESAGKNIDAGMIDSAIETWSPSVPMLPEASAVGA